MSCLHLVAVFLYRELHGAPLQPLEFELDDGPAIEALLAAYPEAVLVSELPHPSEELEDKIALAQVLYKEGFLLIYDEASKPENGEDEVDDDNPFWYCTCIIFQSLPRCYLQNFQVQVFQLFFIMYIHLENKLRFKK